MWIHCHCWAAIAYSLPASLACTRRPLLTGSLIYYLSICLAVWLYIYLFIYWLVCLVLQRARWCCLPAWCRAQPACMTSPATINITSSSRWRHRQWRHSLATRRRLVRGRRHPPTTMRPACFSWTRPAGSAAALKALSDRCELFSFARWHH